MKVTWQFLSVFRLLRIFSWKLCSLSCVVLLFCQWSDVKYMSVSNVSLIVDADVDKKKKSFLLLLLKSFHLFTTLSWRCIESKFTLLWLLRFSSRKRLWKEGNNLKFEPSATSFLHTQMVSQNDSKRDKVVFFLR